MSALNPILYPTVWSYITIGGAKSPGLANVGECKRKNVWDVKRGKGARGATITYTGEEPATFAVTFTLWRVPGVTSPLQGGVDDFAAWDLFRPLLKYDPTKATIQAIDIFHPSLVDIDVVSVVTESIGNIQHKGKGRYEVVVEFLEYYPPPAANATASPAGSATGVPTSAGGNFPPNVPPATQTAQQLLDQLKQQAGTP
jgi:hypothetical protein